MDIFKPDQNCNEDLGFSNAKVFLTGYSASSNVIYKTIVFLNENDNKFHSPSSPIEVIGGMCCCANFNYEETKLKLESTLVGIFYSFCLALVLKTFISANEHIHDDIDATMLQGLKSAKLLSDFDKVAYPLYGYTSYDELNRSYSTHHDNNKISIPFLTMQPYDDPMYLWSYGSVRSAIPLQQYIANSNIIFIEPSHGNHFGFYEGISF